MFRDFLWIMLIFWLSQGCKVQRTAVDSQVSLPGKWNCTDQLMTDNISEFVCFQKTDTLVIQYANDALLINRDPALDFTYTWRTYHSEPFFDAIFFDKKVRPLYRDSIKVISVYEYTNQEDLVMPCVRCNGFAEIKFMRNIYKVPHRFSDEMLNIIKSYDRTIYFNDKYLESTMFTSKNSSYTAFIQIQLRNGKGLYLIRLTTKEEHKDQVKLMQKIKIIQQPSDH